jgi:hypothetical protein
MRGILPHVGLYSQVKIIHIDSETWAHNLYSVIGLGAGLC